MSGGRARSPHVVQRALVGVGVVATVLLTACDPPFPGDDDFYRPPSQLPGGRAGRHHLVPVEPLHARSDQQGPRPRRGGPAGHVPVDRRPGPAHGGDAAPSSCPPPRTAAAAAGRWSPTRSEPGVSATPPRPPTRCRRAPTTRACSSPPPVAKGWAVAVSDYQGLGTPGLHTYMVGPAQGKAVLDVARAAQRLPGHRSVDGTPVGLMGYSQGGGAAGWAGRARRTYAPELKVKGIAAGRRARRPHRHRRFLDGVAVVALALLAGVGFDAAYSELDLETYLNPGGQDLIASARTCASSTPTGSSPSSTWPSPRSTTTSPPIRWTRRLAGPPRTG